MYLMSGAFLQAVQKNIGRAICALQTHAHIAFII